ncbi:MAG: hypothetical protein NC548_21360 [Lachnospiraceae bacterium]|nr:hypothetical protein [Lachnospiraceae bacterium]
MKKEMKINLTQMFMCLRKWTWVFPFVFADRDLVIDDEDEFTYGDVKNHIQHFKSTGWRLPSYDDIFGLASKMFSKDNCDYKTDYTTGGWRNISGTSLITHDTLTFNDISPVYGCYWLLDYMENDFKINKTKMVRVWWIGDNQLKGFDNFTFGDVNRKHRI